MELIEKELYADSIAYSYRYDNPILTGVYISCKIGDVVGLLGRNGCGKSTLMKILFGVIAPKNGLIRLNGYRVSKAFQSKKMCYLPQDRFLPTNATVFEMINLMVDCQDNKNSLLKDEVLSKVQSQKIAELSVGEQRYLELQILLSLDADFYLLDEPFSGVSPFLKEKIQKLIQFHKSTKGFIISDHHYDSVLDISTQVLLLQNGGCRKINSKKDLELFYVPEGTFDE